VRRSSGGVSRQRTLAAHLSALASFLRPCEAIIALFDLECIPEALRMESSRISLESPPASHIENPLSLVCLMNFPFAEND